jgi:hypothetical protein
MAETTISAILDRFATLLEAEPLNLVSAGDPFSDTAIPNVSVGSTYRLMSGGLVRDTQQSNYMSARVERVTVIVQAPLNFDGYQAQRDLQDVCDAIERAVIAAFGVAPKVGIAVEKGSRKITRKKDSDVCEASLSFQCDYDFNEAA